MTKKDYELIAEVIGTVSKDCFDSRHGIGSEYQAGLIDCIAKINQVFASRLKNDNPKFDYSKFYEYIKKTNENLI